ncbi:MAG: dienelactone hydrolase family protein [Caulobacteraceae bacterium]
MGQSTIIQSPDGRFGAYLASPIRANPPAIVIIQEIFGVNAVMRAITDRFAAAGYLAICPDLFWRIEPGIDITDQSEGELKRAFDLFGAFDVDRGVEDLGATLTHVRAAAGGVGKAGAVGYCLGGLLAFLTATRTDADSCVAYYGVGLENHLDEAADLSKPLMLHIAEEDQFVSKGAQRTIISSLEARPKVAIYTYPGRGHAFAREGGDHYHAADAALAEERTLAFFGRTL